MERVEVETESFAEDNLKVYLTGIFEISKEEGVPHFHMIRFVAMYYPSHSMSLEPYNYDKYDKCTFEKDLREAFLNEYGNHIRRIA